MNNDVPPEGREAGVTVNDWTGIIRHPRPTSHRPHVIYGRRDSFHPLQKIIATDCMRSSCWGKKFWIANWNFRLINAERINVSVYTTGENIILSFQTIVKHLNTQREFVHDPALMTFWICFIWFEPNRVFQG